MINITPINSIRYTAVSFVFPGRAITLYGWEKLELFLHKLFERCISLSTALQGQKQRLQRGSYSQSNRLSRTVGTARTPYLGLGMTERKDVASNYCQEKSMVEYCGLLANRPGRQLHSEVNLVDRSEHLIFINRPAGLLCTVDWLPSKLPSV